MTQQTITTQQIIQKIKESKQTLIPLYHENYRDITNQKLYIMLNHNMFKYNPIIEKQR